MKPSPISVVMLVVSLFLAPAVLAQSPDSANQGAASPAPLASTAEVPRLIKFSGTLLDALDRPLAGPVGVTFALHAQQTGGAALWMETQNVTPDVHGLYTVLLGANSAHGVPAELFASGEARWLEVQVEREAEQPRVLLVSVPYALKAADADTLGGKPLSAFVTTGQVAGGSGSAIGKGSASAGVVVPAVSGTGTTNVVAKWVDNLGTLGNSQIFDDGTHVGIGTASPARSLHIRSAAPVIRLEDSTLPNSFWELQQSAFVTDTFGFLRYENGAAVQAKSFVVSSAGNLGIGTGTPQRKLHIKSAAPIIRLEDSTLPNSFWELQQSAFFVDTFGFLRYESGVAVPSKSFVMSSAGNFGIGITAPGQKLSVAGMIQSTTGGFMFPDSTVQTTASLGGSVSSVGSGLGLTGGPITGSGTLAINPTVVPQLGAKSNTFAGSITANSFTGSGAGLSNVNAAMLNGLASTAFATVGANSFTGNESVTGNVSLTGNLGLPNTTSGTVGVITLGGTPFAHNFGPANAANTFIGLGAGNFNMTGVLNSAFGLGALSSNTDGFDNSSFGVDALLTNASGFDNSAFGVNALSSNTTGQDNSAFGSSALDGLTSGNFNIAIGVAAGTNLVGSESNNIYIGNAGVASESNKIRIGNTDISNGPVQTAAFVAGISGVNVSGAPVLVSSSGQLGVAVSSRRFKDDIADMGSESDLLMKLRPVAFYYKPELDPAHTRQYGLVAEEVAQVSPELVIFDKDGAPQTVRYHFVNAMLLNEVQKQRQLVEEQQSTITRQKAEIQDLAARLAKLEALVSPVR